MTRRILMKDNITAPFPAGPWKFEAKTTGDRDLVTESSDVPPSERLIATLRQKDREPDSDRQRYAKALIMAAPDLFIELADIVLDLDNLAIKWRESDKPGCADEVESRIREIRSVLARATTIPFQQKTRYVVKVAVVGIGVTGGNADQAERHVRADFRDRAFRKEWNWSIARSAVEAPYLELTTEHDVNALCGFTVERTMVDGADYEFSAYLEAVVEAASAEAADAAALALFDKKRAKPV